MHDTESMRAVYDRYARAVFTIALSVLGDWQRAEDAVQITFTKAWHASSTVDELRGIAPWLYTIARHVAIDLYRRDRRHRLPRHTDEPAVAGVSLETIWERREIGRAVNDLPAVEREIVQAQHYLGLSHAQIADHLRVPIGTVKSRSHRAHRRLATRLRHLRIPWEAT
ncbi:MAG TPA: sigma-70 family RNA polymerase sigma factor [Actinophytocola sp.]|uniref:RNA polymerase sigma factor n=1 Tax=Actinophytocola sp. TaxID=1872138 RepID=UPI002DDDB686|nr:sigma-70 family RNA polymerase sigma factor [Actinophytocola sp.]HEV2783014.1 sigma-70 family RNA polymerase sigma factor [Actinophytocola sp.]